MSFAFNYVENSINEVEQRNVTLYIVAQDVKLDFGLARNVCWFWHASKQLERFWYVLRWVGNSLKFSLLPRRLLVFLTTRRIISDCLHKQLQFVGVWNAYTVYFTYNLNCVYKYYLDIIVFRWLHTQSSYTPLFSPFQDTLNVSPWQLSKPCTPYSL